MQKLIKKIIFSGETLSVTGLMIGGTNSALGIGGPDKMVIRDPKTNLPYIPGSSLKGKMRSLLEISSGNFRPQSRDIEHGPAFDDKLISTCLFGNAPKTNEGFEQRPSRAIFRDSLLLNGDEFKNTDLPYTEAKTEVVIDRITSKANPRTFERVPAGARFGLKIIINIFEGDRFNENQLTDELKKGLRLIEDDYLGASGSRGSGQVKFILKKITARSIDYYSGNVAAEIELPVDDQFSE